LALECSELAPIFPSLNENSSSLAPICSFCLISFAYELQQELLKLYSNTKGIIIGCFSSGLTSFTISMEGSDSSS
jgi:hypothetical protein